MTKRKAILEVLRFCRGCLGLCSNKYNFQRWKGGEQGSKGEAGGALSGPHLQPPLYHVCLFDYEKWMCNVYSSDSPTCVCGSNVERGDCCQVHLSLSEIVFFKSCNSKLKTWDPSSKREERCWVCKTIWIGKGVCDTFALCTLSNSCGGFHILASFCRYIWKPFNLANKVRVNNGHLYFVRA